MLAMSALGLSAWTLAGRTRAAHYGATEDEVARPRPGDDLVAEPAFVATRAITIERRRQDVWPWIAQLGQGRAGFYSYARIENLIGCHITNAEQIHPEWQDIAVGDDVRLHPRAPALRVLGVRRSEFLLLGEPDVFTWLLALDPVSDAVTRLVARSRGSFGLPHVLGFALEPVHFAMERKMLLGIRERAEAVASGSITGID
jgi:hypothetical protein